MHFQTFVLALFSSAVAAQSLSASAILSSAASRVTGVTSGSGSSSACDAQIVLDTCVSSTKAFVASCTPNDYGCLCTQYTALLQCYNVCPNDSGRFGVEQTKLSNCNAALANPTSTSSAYSAPGSAMSTTMSSNSGSATVGSAAPSSSSKAGAGVLGVEVGGLVMGVVGVMAGLL